MYLTFTCSILSLACLFSCSSEDDFISTDFEENRILDSEILSFNNSESFNDALNALSGNGETSLRSSGNPDDGNDLTNSLSKGNSLYEQESYNEYYEEYVPNHNMAKLLNKEGEIVVDNKFYKITPNGTYFCELKDKEKLKTIYLEDSLAMGIPVSDKLFEIADGIFRYDTYYYKEDSEFCSEDMPDQESTTELRTTGLRAAHYGTDPNPDYFPTLASHKNNIFGVIWRNILQKPNAHTQYYESMNDRRVRGEFYENNYVFHVEIGVKGWTDKKNWIGWRNILIVTELNDYQKQMYAKINDAKLQNQPQLIRLPGSQYHLNTKTFTIPDADLTSLKKHVNNGSKAVFDYFRSKYNELNKSEWDKLDAAIAVSRTHIYQYIKSEDIIKLDEDYYHHIFASSTQMEVTISNTFYNTITTGSGQQSALTLGKWIVDIIRAAMKVEHPTLHCGEIYVCARFSNMEWAGMKIVKK